MSKLKSDMLGLIYSDVCGLMEVESWGDHKSFEIKRQGVSDFSTVSNHG